ncbi:permease-like cell division protein FtsX [Paractinoplanes brasiliensis]|uniref:FtsX extracellular domain-containing protein n=1 Tax=Paractinoplanes brasiliensis TaxID=52695 RepID=A0A4R6JAD1_9ACTN|nr:permease-like cell division protein FtsX [Actinoplanes brasiliensis]TDO32599.1 hypothetical protein C8E87_8067 [Actinoplanes brasiliensis]GID27522.1 hypothetical protein Abr02nite_25050 [Actinoplanes brasiliensis]
MDGNLREQFDRAVGDDPGADPAVLAHAAITEGGRVRRRRRMTAAGGVAAGLIAVLSVVALRPGAPEPAAPPVTIAAAMMPLAAANCTPGRVVSGVTEVAMFLEDSATGQQRAAIRSALDGDKRVKSFDFENRREAYERFKALWSDSPDFVASVAPKDVPESFRVKLVDDSVSTRFEAQYAAMPGVVDVVGRICPSPEPPGVVK